MKILLFQMFGLGNQLFEYAAGLYFAEKYGASLEIIREPDHRAVSFGHPRPFLLSNFCISAPVRECRSWDRLIGMHRKVAVATSFVCHTALYQQPNYHDWAFIPDLPVTHSTKRVYLDGVFLAYQYAQGVEQRLRSELSFRNPASGKNLDTLEQIRAAENSVSLHVRHGDHAVWLGGSRLLSFRYYERAMQAILERISNPTFFVFSDDMAYARAKLPKGEHFIFVEHNDEANAQEDLRLMSACRHQIIPNSSLSWWGAWLNPNPQKLVCAPRAWGLKNPPEWPFDTIPPDWMPIATDDSAA